MLFQDDFCFSNGLLGCGYALVLVQLFSKEYARASGHRHKFQVLGEWRKSIYPCHKATSDTELCKLRMLILSELWYAGLRCYCHILECPTPINLCVNSRKCKLRDSIMLILIRGGILHQILLDLWVEYNMVLWLKTGFTVIIYMRNPWTLSGKLLINYKDIDSKDACK